MESLGKKIFSIFFRDEENECVRKKLIVMYKEVLFMEANGVQTKKHKRKLCAASSCSGIYGIISMNKLLNFLLQ
jgi:hypothetical protein